MRKRQLLLSPIYHKPVLFRSVIFLQFLRLGLINGTPATYILEDNFWKKKKMFYFFRQTVRLGSFSSLYIEGTKLLLKFFWILGRYFAVPVAIY